jgi:hypothetical protein
VSTTGTFEATTIDGTLDGTTSGAMIGELMGLAEWGGAGAWEGGGIGVEAGSFQGGGAAVIEGVQAIEYTHDLGQVRTSPRRKPGVINRPEITVKDPERIGMAKWKMIDRESQDRGTWIKQDLVRDWQEAKDPREPKLGGEPLEFVPHIEGQIGAISLIKCLRAVYRNLIIEEEMDDVDWGDGLQLNRQRWGRWVLDTKAIRRGAEITLRGRQFGLRRNEIVFLMLTMRSWGMTSLTGGSVNRTGLWFRQLRTEAT